MGLILRRNPSAHGVITAMGASQLGGEEDPMGWGFIKAVLDKMPFHISQSGNSPQGVRMCLTADSTPS